MPGVEAPLNPARNPQFATAFRGYDQIKVDEYVNQLKGDLAITAQHRDEATTSVAQLTKSLGYAQQELAEAKAALARMAEDPAGAAAMSERVKTMMRLAEEEIAELRDKAEQDAASTRDAADVYADKTRQNAQAVAEQLAKEAEERRAAADKKAQDEIAANRTEAERAVAELQASAKQRADAMISDAQTQLAEAQAKHKEALELRATVADRLAASHTALQEAVKRLSDAPDSEVAMA